MEEELQTTYKTPLPAGATGLKLTSGLAPLPEGLASTPSPQRRRGGASRKRSCRLIRRRVS